MQITQALTVIVAIVTMGVTVNADIVTPACMVSSVHLSKEAALRPSSPAVLQI